jgi:predicted anti-sigma-YlaC factor YlaD
MNLSRKALIATLSLVMAGPALAVGEGFDIKVGRDYYANVKSGAITSVALGEDAHSAINMGGMLVNKTNVDIGRDYRVNVQTGAVTSVALGKGVTSYVNVGGIMSNPGHSGQ